MRYLIFFIIILLLFSSCKKQSELSTIFECSSTDFDNLTVYKDFNKNFKLKIPNNWKTELYYNKNLSEIFSADTTKQLSETFILDVTYNYGELNFEDSFFKKTDSLIVTRNLKTLKKNTFEFKKKPAFWYVVKGTKKGFKYHQFNLLVKINPNSYLSATSEIYGANAIEERICSSIKLIEKIELLQ